MTKRATTRPISRRVNPLPNTRRGTARQASLVLTSPSKAWRAAANIPGWNTKQFTLYLEATPTAVSAASNTFWLFIGDADGGNNGFYVQQRSASGAPWRHAALSGGGSTPILDVQKDNFNAGLHKLAIVWDGTNVKFWFDGVLTCMDAATLPTDMDGIGIGCIGSAASSTFLGTLGRFEYHPYAMNDLEAAAKTRGIIVKSGITRDPALNVIGFEGDSTVCGTATGPATYTNTSLMKMIKNDGVLAAYADSYDVSTSSIFKNLDDSRTSEVSFAGTAIDYLAGQTAQTWAALPICKVGSAMIANWSLNQAGSNFDKIAQSVGQSAIRQSMLADAHGTLRTLVFGVGVNDAIAGNSAASFKAAAKDYIARRRAALGRDVPYVIRSLHAWASGTGATQNNWNAINGALQEIATEVGGCRLADISAVAGASGDEEHYDLTGTVSVGNTVGAAVKTLLGL